MQVLAVIILTFISSWIFGKSKFSTPVSALKLSYLKTLGGKITNEELIKESLFQLKITATLFASLFMVLLPFLIAISILLALDRKVEDYFLNIQNQLIVLISFITFGVIKKYVSK